MSIILVVWYDCMISIFFFCFFGVCIDWGLSCSELGSSEGETGMRFAIDRASFVFDTISSNSIF